MPYVPPHKRPGYKPASPPKPQTKRRGVHYKSYKTGLPSSNLKVYEIPRERFMGQLANIPYEAEEPSPSRSTKAKSISKSLARRTVKATRTMKSAMKGKKTLKRQTRSASPTKGKKKSNSKKAKSK